MGCRHNEDRYKSLCCLLTVHRNSWILQCTLLHNFQFKTFQSSFSNDMMWAVMNTEWLIACQVFGALYLWICRRLFSERRLWKIMEKNTRLMQWCGPGSTWSQDEMLALHSKAVHNTLMRHIRAQSHGAESVQSWLIVMRTAVHLLTEYATHITLPA